MTEKDFEFLQRWLKLLDLVDPNIRGKVNQMSMALTDKYVALHVDGQVQIAEKEGTRK